MLITTIKTANDTVIRQKIAANSITTDMDADLRDQIADELLDRGIVLVSDQAGLQAQSLTNTSKVYMNGTGLFTHTPTAPQSGVFFPAAGGGFWLLTDRKSRNQWMLPKFRIRHVFEDGAYNGFPVVVERNNVLYCFFQHQPVHIVPSEDIAYIKSVDGGLTWSNRIIIASQTNANFSFGVTRSGRLVILVSNQSNTNTYVFRTGIHDEVFTNTSIMSNPFPAGESCNFGKIKQLPSGRLIGNYYRYDVGNEKTGLVTSVDDGATWTYYADIFSGLNETSFEVISGTNDANTVIMAICRVVTPDSGKNKVYRSNNGGTSWSLVGEVPFSRNIVYGFPGETIVKDGRLYVVFGVRYTNAQMFVSMWDFPVSDFGTIANWGIEKTFYISEAAQKGAANDWGYPSLYQWDNEIYGMFYESSPTALAALPTESTRIINLRITNRVEGLFTRGTQGTFPSETTFSKLGLPWAYDSAGFSKEVSGVYFIVAPVDGLYMARLRGTYANTSLTGTWRKMGLAVLDMGYPVDAGTLFPENPINGNPAPEAVKYIFSDVRTVIDDPDNLTFELTGTFFARKGNEIMPYGKHNAPGQVIAINNIELEIFLIE